VTDSLFVVDRNDYLQDIAADGVANQQTRCHGRRSHGYRCAKIPADMASAEVALLFEQRNLVSAPVVSETALRKNHHR
jgi:magnesium transporter